MRDEVCEVETLGRLGAQKFLSRRNVVEEIADCDGGANGSRRREDIAHPPAFDHDARRVGFAFVLCNQFDAGDRRNRIHRLAAKAQS